MKVFPKKYSKCFLEENVFGGTEVVEESSEEQDIITEKVGR